MDKILFSDKYSLTQAVLDGRKTMTRRVCKYDRPDETYDIVFPVFEPNDYDNDGNIVSPLNYAFGWKNDKGDFTGWNIPKYKVGEVIAVAQPYRDIVDESAELSDILLNKNGKPNDEFLAGWNNKMFVRASLMPHHICITNIKIERLQDISDKDCLKEGIVKQEVISDRYPFLYAYDAFLNGSDGYFASRWFNNPRNAFATLIDKVSRKGTWKSNPYVFVYDFELVD